MPKKKCKGAKIEKSWNKDLLWIVFPNSPKAISPLGSRRGGPRAVQLEFGIWQWWRKKEIAQWVHGCGREKVVCGKERSMCEWRKALGRRGWRSLAGRVLDFSQSFTLMYVAFEGRNSSWFCLQAIVLFYFGWLTMLKPALDKVSWT
jgi:hypothetical protein